MNKKLLKRLKLISIVCVIILIIEVFYLIYVSFFKSSKSIYFDSTNSLDVVEKGFISAGSNNDNDKHYEKAKITKYNSKMEKSFEKLYNKGYNGAFFSVIEDDDGYVAVGSYEADESEYRRSARSALIVKFDKSGEVIFENSFQMLGNSKFVNIVSVDDGYLVVGQSIYEDMSLGTSRDGGAYLVKYNKSLKLEWKSNYGGNKSAVYNDLVVYDNYIYTVGKDLEKSGIISKYDMNGNLIKTVVYEYTDNLGFSSVAQVNGNIVVSGAKYIEDGKSAALLALYDSQLNYIKESCYSDDGSNRFNNFMVDENNNIIVIGMKKIDKKSDLDIFSYDGIIGKYDKNLTEIETLIYSNDKDDHFTDIKIYDDNYIVSGYSSYEKHGYMTKFIVYSKALKVLEVR